MQEKRQNKRYQKKYSMVFSLKDGDEKAYDISGLLDISKGGLRFTSQEAFLVGQGIKFQIKFPFLYPQVTTIEGEVISSYKIPESFIYQISVKFVKLNSDTMLILNEMEKINQKSK